MSQCCVCENKKQPLLVLRGLCSTSRLDQIYVPHNPDHSGRLTYVGLYGTVIEYNKDSLSWEAAVSRDVDVMTRAVSVAPEESLLLGSFQWKIFNDSRECTIEESYTALLTMSGCSGTQFRTTLALPYNISLSPSLEKIFAFQFQN